MMSTRTFRRLGTLAGLAGVCGASLSGCGGGGDGGQTGPPPGRSVCAPNDHLNGRARWTVLVYMNAANNLQPDSLTNMAQMAAVGSDATLNVVVQWKQASCQDCGAPSFLGTRRYLVKTHSAAERNRILAGDTTVLDADRLPDPVPGGTVDMGDWRTMRDFVQWGSRTYPADHIAFVVWDHGSGWRPTRAGGKRFRAVSQDSQSGNEINTWELPQAFDGPPQPIDALLFDASLEQMTEVAYELRNNARVMVGSEESPPGAGYPYDAWLSQLKARTMNPCDLGNAVIQTFVAAYPRESNITQSMLDLTRLQTVAAALDSFGSALLAHTRDLAATIQTARDGAQHYTVGYEDNKDLYHYTDLIRNGAANASDVQLAATNLETALRGANGAVLNTAHGPSQDNSNGLAIWIPRPGGYLTAFNNLAIARVGAPRWASFLQQQVR